MAGSLIEMPVNGASDWSNFVTITQQSYKAMIFVSLTEWDTTTAPQLEGGSRVVIDGAMYQFTSDETITGLAGIANSTEFYIKVVPAGASCTVVATTDAPTWSADKGGWYDGSHRYIGGMYKNESGNYVNKWLYQTNRQNHVKTSQQISKKIVNIGIWDMENTSAIVRTSDDIGVSIKRIRDLSIKINNDHADDSTYGYFSDLTLHKVTEDRPAGEFYIYIGSTTPSTLDYIQMNRRLGGHFWSAAYDSTGINRGNMNITYVDLST